MMESEKYCMEREEEEMKPNSSAVQYGWDVGLCRCGDSIFPNCISSFIFPCVPLAQMYHHQGFMKYAKALSLFALLRFCQVVLFFIPETTAYDDSSIHHVNDNNSPRSLIAIENTSWSGSGDIYDPDITVRGVGKEDKTYYVYALHPFSCVLGILVSVVFCTFVSRLRTNIRKQMGIGGGLCDDFLLSCCCTPCVVAQMATQLKIYTNGVWNLGPPTQKSNKISSNPICEDISTFPVAIPVSQHSNAIILDSV